MIKKRMLIQGVPPSTGFTTFHALLFRNLGEFIRIFTFSYAESKDNCSYIIKSILENLKIQVSQKLVFAGQGVRKSLFSKTKTSRKVSK